MSCPNPIGSLITPDSISACTSARISLSVLRWKLPPLVLIKLPTVMFFASGKYLGFFSESIKPAIRPCNCLPVLPLKIFSNPGIICREPSAWSKASARCCDQLCCLGDKAPFLLSFDNIKSAKRRTSSTNSLPVRSSLNDTMRWPRLASTSSRRMFPLFSASFIIS